MEDLPEALLAEIVLRIASTSDLNSLSLVSKRLYIIDSSQRSAIRIGCGSFPAREALASLCSRFPNLSKVEIDYAGWTSGHGNQLDNKDLLVISSQCPSLTELTLSFCSDIDDSGLRYLAYCKKLIYLRLNSVPEITSSGLLSVAVSCKSLSGLLLIACEKIGSVEWLEYLGWNGILEELVVKNCKGISQYDLLQFGPGWMKLRKFDFEMKGGFWGGHSYEEGGFDPLYNVHKPSRSDIWCESLKDLRLACFKTETEVGLRFLLGKCKSLERLCLEYVHGLNDNDIIVLSESCRNLKSISLWLTPTRYDDLNGDGFRTAFTDNSLKALALNCLMLEAVELTFAGCEHTYPSEIGFTQKGLVVLIQSCPIRVLVLNGANFFDDEGMMTLSSAPLLETLELVDCREVTDAGLCFIARTPCLINLTLRHCKRVTDVGVAELVNSQKLKSLIIDCCRRVSEKAVLGAGGSVQYSVETASPGGLKRIYPMFTG
ncbi:F-box/LRR-repeat protein 14 [Lolium perenne]|uniref:F-box/LRR-repeat protein 14 n=1 Tax=Lolium perenne TaxID=4522 RepID=UPI0021EAC0F7|nr:F-box/LRR-repeat protein 14-like [Lolium perenne]XP_051206426.1 F-box/LRR-repeat protein 14-like [Lolium perenne]